MKDDEYNSGTIKEDLFHRSKIGPPKPGSGRHSINDRLNRRVSGETPADYFMRFKRMIRAATKDGFFRSNPAEDVAAKAKPSGKMTS